MFSCTSLYNDKYDNSLPKSFYIILSGAVDIIVKMDDIKAIPQPSKEFLEKKQQAELLSSMSGGTKGRSLSSFFCFIGLFV